MLLDLTLTEYALMAVSVAFLGLVGLTLYGIGTGLAFLGRKLSAIPAIARGRTGNGEMKNAA